MKFLRRLSFGASTPSSSLTTKSSAMPLPESAQEPENLVKATSIHSADSTTVCTEPSEHSSFSYYYNYTCLDASCSCSRDIFALESLATSTYRPRRVQFAPETVLYSAPWMYTDDDENEDQNDEQDMATSDEETYNNEAQPLNIDNEMLVIPKQTIWYNSTDVSRFKSHVKVFVRRLQMREKYQQASSCATNNAIATWTTRLHEAFCALENPAANTEASNIKAILSTARQTDALLVGLEKWVLFALWYCRPGR